MIKKLYTPFYADENVLYFNEDSAYLAFSYYEVSVLNIDLNNSNLDNNFDEDNPVTILMRLLVWHIKFEKHKVLRRT